VTLFCSMQAVREAGRGHARFPPLLE